MTRRITLLWVLLLSAGLWPAMAQTTLPVDDSASQVLGNGLDLHLPPVTARGTPLYLASGEVTVRVRLDMSPWKGRQGRIYMRLQEQPGDNIIATWTTRGRLLPGTVRAGERSLVYAGPITSTMIVDTLRLRINVDTRTPLPSRQLAFSFEIDLDSP